MRLGEEGQRVREGRSEGVRSVELGKSAESEGERYTPPARERIFGSCIYLMSYMERAQEKESASGQQKGRRKEGEKGGESWTNALQRTWSSRLRESREMMRHIQSFGEVHPQGGDVAFHLC